VISLVFVGIEIRGNTRASQAAGQHSLLELAFSNNNLVLADAELGVIDAAILGGRGSDLTDQQMARANGLIANKFNIWEAAFYDNATDQLHPQLWRAWNAFNESRLNSRDMRAWWYANRHGFGSDFAEHVDAVARRVEPSGQ